MFGRVYPLPYTIPGYQYEWRWKNVCGGFSHLVYTTNKMAITGEGTFDGVGESWRLVKKNKVTTAVWEELKKAGLVREGVKI
jgi:hypothetical protein